MVAEGGGNKLSERPGARGGEWCLAKRLIYLICFNDHIFLFNSLRWQGSGDSRLRR